MQHAAVWGIHHLRMVIPTVRRHAINRAPVHVRDRHVRQMRPVPMAVHLPVVPNITVVRAVRRHPHVQSAYLVTQDITKAAAAVQPVRVSVRQICHNHVHAVRPARN